MAKLMATQSSSWVSSQCFSILQVPRMPIITSFRSRTGITAVSYTHLDVYKRQALSEGTSSPGGSKELQAEREFWFHLGICAGGGRGISLQGPCPVSYTHLDVYKRQIPGGAGGTGQAFWTVERGE